MAISENGWPVLSSGSAHLYRWAIPTKQGTVYLLMRSGSVGFVLAFWVSLFAARIQPVFGKVLDDWGYAYREIRSSTGWSNHASATAVDLNALQHPLGKVGTMVKASLVRLLLKTRMRGRIKWGGDYQNRKDEMHFEIYPGIQMPECEALAKTLLKTKRGKAIIAANPTQMKVINS